MSQSQEIGASISLRRPSFPGRSRVLTERGKPIEDLNPHRIRVLRKKVKQNFAAAHQFADKARPFLARCPTDPHSYDFQHAENFVREMQEARECAHRILRTLRATRVVDGRGQRWGGEAGRTFRTDAGDAMGVSK